MSRRTLRSLVIGSIALGIGVTGTLVANAQWSVPGQAAVRVATGVVPAGGPPTAKKRGDEVIVSWRAQVIAPGVRIQRYVVTARDTQVPRRPAVTHTVPASGADAESTAFTLAELGNGKWNWTVAPKYQLWSGAEGPPSTPSVPVGADRAPTALPVTAPQATATVKTGATAKADMTPSSAPTATKQQPTDPATPGAVESGEPAKTTGPEADPAAAGSPSAIDSPAVSP